jgi:hypothetical protein
MKKRFSIPALAVAVAIAGFLSLTMVPKSFAAAQAANKGVSFSLSGQYIARGFWAQNQTEYFISSPGYPTSNTFQAFTQRLRLNAALNYGTAGGGMPLASILTQFDLTNDYNPTGLAPNGYGTNGWSTLGYTAAPTGFNHDFNTFGLRQAYLRLVSPVGMWMVGRMPVKFGLGIAVNTNADGLGDFLPLSSADLGVFLGVLIGNETTSYSSYSPAGTQFPAIALPAISPTYSHIQMGTIPTLEVMMLKPVNHFTGSLWLTEAHLNQFTALPGPVYNPQTNTFNANVDENIYFPTANVTFGGLSGTYNSGKGTIVKGEFDYFRGRIIASNAAITGYPNPYYNSNGVFQYNQGYFLPVQPSGSNQYDSVNSYDLYLSGSQAINASMPLTLGVKFGIGAPIANGDYNFTYYSMQQNTRTLFGNVLGSNWQPIMMTSPGINYIYTTASATGANLANKWGLMVDLTEHFGNGNSLEEAVVHESWLKTSMNITGNNYSTQMFGGSNIGNEFDLDFTHHFTKTLAWQAWGGYVWTGSGVDSYSATSTGGVPSTATHKDITALGTAVIWNF